MTCEEAYNQLVALGLKVRYVRKLDQYPPLVEAEIFCANRSAIGYLMTPTWGWVKFSRGSLDCLVFGGAWIARENEEVAKLEASGSQRVGDGLSR